MKFLNKNKTGFIDSVSDNMRNVKQIRISEPSESKSFVLKTGIVFQDNIKPKK
ncbi:hypothetical protein [Butyrivibrio sp. YAB3001]|uniref:hypothetical protein n=1 Tax=Butyrivibrio sp. YAB3001 TaxID=1520812 RepID=UPI0008F63B4D|nr:hypothetical protein [Butyrivibrio sp. YAB3001]SFD02969.1 hypothetical protein SAMN02910398_03837 [Butyrivibrio sp. YAB3001]